jgi:hypothetical protein
MSAPVGCSCVLENRSHSQASRRKQGSCDDQGGNGHRYRPIAVHKLDLVVRARAATRENANKNETGGLPFPQALGLRGQRCGMGHDECC